MVAAAPGAVDAPPVGLRERLGATDQGLFVALVTLVLFIIGLIGVDGFASIGNVSALVRLTSALGIVSVGAAIVIMAKGVDLSAAAIVAVVAQGTVDLWSDNGLGETKAILIMLSAAAFMGLLNGWLVAYVEVPALFVTLGTWQLFQGFSKITFLELESYTVPSDGSIVKWMGRGEMVGIPVPIILAGLVFLGAWLFISMTTYGRLIRAIGDNPMTARLTGIPVRPLQVATYTIGALLAALAAFMILGNNGGYSTSYGAGGDLLFDAITIAIIGGVSLTGGRGSIFGVLAGTALIGVIVNMMTLLDFSIVQRNLTKGIVLMLALAIDAWLHPRDEETAKSDDL